MAEIKVGARRLRVPKIPFFRVFYSLTYTILYLLTIVFLAITPITMIYTTIQQTALQYTVMIGGAYVLTAIIVIFIYSSRLYTNRSVLSAVGKAYIPVEDGEIGKGVRKMIVKQLERSAIVAWESRPRDLYGEILLAEQDGLLPPETDSVNRNDYLVGTEIRVDPVHPPWGDVQHLGWSSPSHTIDNKTPNVQFDNVVHELPHLIEARAVSLAPADPALTPVPGEPQSADPVVVDLLKRPASMAMREYLTQLSYLGLVQPAAVGQKFLSQYERARFAGQPISVDGFNSLMKTFAELLTGMTTLDDAIVDEIREQTKSDSEDVGPPMLSLPFGGDGVSARTPSPRHSSPQSTARTPVTAREGFSSRAATPYLQQDAPSQETLGSVIHNSSPLQFDISSDLNRSISSSSSGFESDAGSVLRRDVVPDAG